MTDLIIVGYGLSSSLLAYRLLMTRPDISFKILDNSQGSDSSKTWSFFASDVEDPSFWEPLVSQSWPSWEVQFPGFQRSFQGFYHSARSEDLLGRVQGLIGDRLIRGVEAASVQATEVVSSDGQRFSARVVLDARGKLENVPGGYQSFYGIEVTTNRPHQVSAPVIMDARVSQSDGFRFFYLLPWSKTQLLIEDTYYGSRIHFDPFEAEETIKAYARTRGWEVVSVKRRETASLVIPGSSDIFKPNASLSIGVGGGFFHPVTGYSFGAATRVATALSQIQSWDLQQVHDLLLRLRTESYPNRRYFVQLNKMMFGAAKDQDRHKIFRRFYDLDAGLIQRFFGSESRFGDKLRLLTGKPPVPVGRAISAIFSREVSL